jgi:hypothetical protein
MDEIIERQHVTVELCLRTEDERLGIISRAVDLKSNEPLIVKPTILVLGGNKTKDVLVADSNAKCVERFVGKCNEKYDILSVSYGMDYMLNKEKNVRTLSDKLFMPLVSEAGERLPLDKAMKKMRRVNIFAHCAGASRLNDILYSFKQSMDKLGYTSTEKSEILGQISVVAYAPWSFINDRNIKKIYIQSIEDSVSPRVVERLYSIQTKGDSSEYEFSHEELKVGANESYKIFLLRLYKTLMQEELVSYDSKGKNTLCYISKSQSKDYENFDHELKYIIRNNQFDLCDKSSTVADAVSLIVSESLLLTLSQSMINENSKNVEKLYSLSHIKDVCDSVSSKTLKANKRPQDDFFSFLK